ncbi:MAG: tyrosine-protein phosphatase [Candidatus Nanopelagicales bacterium]
MPDLTTINTNPPNAQGLVNLRDVGGLPLRDGGFTRRGVLFRSESLQEATSHDVERLTEQYQIASIMDLRSARESITEGRGPVDAKAITYLNIPLDPAPLDLEFDPDWPSGQLTSYVYQSFANVPSGGLGRVFAFLPQLLDGPTLVHCAAGKDRTGLVIAITLEIAGVTREAVMADYLASGQNNDRVNDMLRRSPRYLAHMGKVNNEFYEVHEHAMSSFLDWLDRTHGGARNWAMSRGVEDSQLDRLAAALRT